MATATASKSVVFTLQLSEDEANFIAGMVQNAFYQNPQDEPPQERQMRESIFEAITNAA
jgi:hypothetical protein